MKTLTDLVEGGLLSQKINSQLGLSNSVTQMLQRQQHWQKQLSGFAMHNALLKSIGEQHTLFARNFTGIDVIAKSIAMQPKFNIPTTAFDAINSINRQHEQLFGNLRGIKDIFKHRQVFSHINSLQIALGAMSSQLTAVAAAQKKWNLLEDFEEISNEAATINEKISDDEGITSESLAEIKNFLQRIEIRVDKIDADASLIFWKILAILSFILAVAGEIRNWTPKPNYATKEEIVAVLKNQVLTFETKLKTQKEYRTTNRICKVMLKPKSKTLVLATLPMDFDVIVLQVNHKWIYVSYTSPKDNLPQTGWVVKKYLSQPK